MKLWSGIHGQQVRRALYAHAYRWLLAFVLLALLGLPQATARAQSSPNGGFDEGVGPSEPVKTMALQADGKILIGGAFMMGGRIGIARLHQDGSYDATFQASADGAVFDIATLPDGRILVGGGYTHMNSQLRSGLARLNADGSLDDAFVAPINGSIFTIALQPDGKILIGGHFSRAGDQARVNLARLNTDGTFDTTFAFRWGPTGREGGWVNSIALQRDRKVLIGGNFDTVSGQPRYHIARIKPEGELDPLFVTGTNGAVHHVAVQTDRKILIGGEFTQVNDGDAEELRDHLARLNPGGTLDDLFEPQSLDGTVYNIAVQPDDKILIGGSFTSFAKQNQPALARMNPNGTPDNYFYAKVDNTVEAIVVEPERTLLIGGQFRQVGGHTRNYVARLGSAGMLVWDQPAGPLFTNPVASNVEQQFADLEPHGDPLAMNLGIGHDPDVCRHYQSVNRIVASDGTPYMSLTRSGVDTGVYCDPWGGWEHYPGELLIVKMESQNKDGERFGTNLLQRGKSWGDTVPPPEDTGVAHIYFNGEPQGPDGERWPAYSHPGGAQLLGTMLVVPLEARCMTSYQGGTSECDQDRIEPRGALILIDVSDPTNPNILHLQEGLIDPNLGLGVVAAVEIRPGEVPSIPELDRKGGYLFALTWGDATNMRFAYIVNALGSNGKPNYAIRLVSGTWNESNLGAYKDKWYNWQSLSFVRDTNGDLYLIGGDKEIDLGPQWADWVGLFKVDLPAVFNTEALPRSISYIAESHLELENPDMGSLDAGSSAYVSPSGQIIFYTAPHDNDAPGGSIEMGEFRSAYVTADRQCGPEVHAEQLQRHVSLREGTTLTSTGPIATYIEPWITFYPDTDMQGDAEHLTMSFSDQRNAAGELRDDWDNLRQFDFGDEADSFRWCGPKDAKLTIYEHDTFNEKESGETILIYGEGRVGGSSDMASDFGDMWHDAASSVKIEWSGPTPLTYSLLALGDSDEVPPGARIDPATGVFAWEIIEANEPKTYSFVIRVCDTGSTATCDEESVTLTVEEVNAAPVLEPIGNQSVPWGTPVRLTARASDSDVPVTTLRFSLAVAPLGASIDAVTGEFSWTPTEAQVGINTIHVLACDNGSPMLCGVQQFFVEVQNRS